MDSARSVYSKFLKAIPKTYAELRDFFEKERPDWLQTLMTRRINAPSKLILDFHAWGGEEHPRGFSRDKSVRIGRNGKAFWRLQRWRPPSS